MSNNINKINQVDYLSYLYGDLAIKPLVREVTFQLTSACNLNCSYCYEHHKENKHMSLETGKKIVDFIIKQWEEDKPDNFINKNIKSLIFTFVGGEPFLCTKVMDGIIEYFLVQCAIKKCDLSKGLQVGITSNGTLYFKKEVQDFIKKYKDFLSLTISIDGIKELHDKNRVNYIGEGSFDIAYKAFKDSRKFGKQYTKMTFVPESFQYIYDSVVFMIENDVKYIACNYAYEPYYSIEDAKVLFEQLAKVADYLIDNSIDIYITMFDHFIGDIFSSDDDRNYCGGTGEMLSFAPDGKAYPCIRYAPISIGEEKSKKMCVGNYNGIYNTEESIKLKNELSAITRTSQSTEECNTCPIMTGCGWCSAYNYEINGTPNKRITNICWAHRARVLATCYYYNKRFLEKRDCEPKNNNIQKEIALQIVGKEDYEKLLDYERLAFEQFNSMEYSRV